MSKLTRILALMLSSAMLLSSAALAVSCRKNKNNENNEGDETLEYSSGTNASIKINTMKVCETDNPIGIDVTPVFSWQKLKSSPLVIPQAALMK